MLSILLYKKVVLPPLFYFVFLSLSLFSFVVLSGFSIFVYQHTYTVLGDNPRQLCGIRYWQYRPLVKVVRRDRRGLLDFSGVGGI